MTLAEVAFDKTVRVLRLDNVEKADAARLHSMGLREGAQITKVLKLPLRDPVECLVGPQLLAIESWLLERIVVDPQPSLP